jgi:hypothetical protein
MVQPSAFANQGYAIGGGGIPEDAVAKRAGFAIVTSFLVLAAFAS